jgi:hypothetical protein
MKNAKLFAAALVCLFAALGYEHFRVSALRTPTAIGASTESAAPVKAHAPSHVTGGTDVIANAIGGTGGAAGLESAADKLLWTQLMSGSRYVSFETEEFQSGGIASGSGVITNATTVAFPANLGWRVASSGTASAGTLVTTGQTAAHFGIIQIETGSTTTGGTGLTRNATNVQNVIVGSGQDWTQRWAFQIPTLSDGTNTFIWRAGYLSTLTSTPADGLFISYSSGAPENGKIICRACNTSVCTDLTTNAPTLSAGQWYQGTNHWDGTNYSCEIDDVSLGTTASNIPTATLQEGTGIQKTAGGTTRTALIDYYSSLRIRAAGSP